MMQKALDTALEFMRGAVEDGEVTLPHAFHCLPDGKLVVTAFDMTFMADWREKNKICLLLLASLFQRGGAIAFISDGWADRVPPGVRRESLPANMGEWPEEYRSETLLAFVNQVGEFGIFGRQLYRREGGRCVFEPFTSESVQSSRFAFDLRSATMQDAMLAAVYRGREGRDVRQ